MNGMPLWVKVFALVGILVVAVLVISLLFGAKHGPGRHGLGSPPARATR